MIPFFIKYKNLKIAHVVEHMNTGVMCHQIHRVTMVVPLRVVGARSSSGVVWGVVHSLFLDLVHRYIQFIQIHQTMCLGHLYFSVHVN